MAHPKGVLIERLQKEGRQPTFKTEATGPDHEPTFLADAMVDGEVLGTGQGGSKRDAEKRAAEEALRYLDRQERSRDAEKSEPKRSSGKRGRGKRTQESEPREAPQAEAAPAATDGPFEGPWPIFEDVLAACLEIANERLDAKQNGEQGVAAVRDLTLMLYKGMLENLGDVVEVGEES